MKARLFTSASFALAVVLSMAPAWAQPKSDAPAAKAAASAAASGCGNPAAKAHDHGAERNAPTLSRRADGTPCPAAAASQPARPGASKPTHDHGRMHKTL